VAERLRLLAVLAATYAIVRLALRVWVWGVFVVTPELVAQVVVVALAQTAALEVVRRLAARRNLPG
jgi:hypothetical protein